MKVVLYPYKPGSASCKELAAGLGIKQISHKNSKFVGGPDKMVINWGASKVPEEVAKCAILNKPENVGIASNKLTFFRSVQVAAKGVREVIVAGQVHQLRVDHGLFDNLAPDFVGILNHPLYGRVDVQAAAVEGNNIFVRTPEFTDKVDLARRWLLEGNTVVERHVLNGHSGEGIRLVTAEEFNEGTMELEKAPLYVKYVAKKQEYRIHVCGDEAVDIQRKARRKDLPDEAINWKIRNHDNGFVFARNEDGIVPPDVVVQAVNAVKACGLDFGAVDVIFNDKSQKAYVLEVNTAPGLTGETLAGYIDRFTRIIAGEPARPLELQEAKKPKRPAVALDFGAPYLDEVPAPAAGAGW